MADVFPLLGGEVGTGEKIEEGIFLLAEQFLLLLEELVEVRREMGGRGGKGGFRKSAKES